MAGLFDELMLALRGRGSGLLGYDDQEDPLTAMAQAPVAQYKAEEPLSTRPGIRGPEESFLSRIADGGAWTRLREKGIREQEDHEIQKKIALERLRQMRAPERPTLEQIEDPQTGYKVPVWKYPDGRLERAQIPGMGSADPGDVTQTRHYREAMAKKAAEEAVNEGELRKGGKAVLDLTDYLQKQIDDPKNPKVREQFSRAAGTWVGRASDADPGTGVGSAIARGAYELGQSREDKAYLDRIKSTAQGIHSSMERAILKGGGQITETERAQVRKILSEIHASRTPDDALKQLEVFRGIARRMFRMDGGEKQRLKYNPATGDFE